MRTHVMKWHGAKSYMKLLDISNKMVPTSGKNGKFPYRKETPVSIQSAMKD
jgi:hypothetical protein